MQSCCALSLLLFTAYGEISNLVKDCPSPNACHGEHPMGDATSLLQQRNLKMSEREHDIQEEHEENNIELEGDEEAGSNQLSSRALLATRGEGGEEFDYCK